MDYELLDGNGIDLTKKLREMMEKGIVSDIPIYFVTAHTKNSKEAKEALEAGAEDVFGKPLRLE